LIEGAPGFGDAFMHGTHLPDVVRAEIARAVRARHAQAAEILGPMLRMGP